MSPISRTQRNGPVPPHRQSGSNPYSARTAKRGASALQAPACNVEPTLAQPANPNQPHHALEQPPKRARPETRPHWAHTFFERPCETAPPEDIATAARGSTLQPHRDCIDTLTDSESLECEFDQPWSAEDEQQQQQLIRGEGEPHEVAHSDAPVGYTLTAEEEAIFWGPDLDLDTCVEQLIQLDSQQEQFDSSLRPLRDERVVENAAPAVVAHAPVVAARSRLPRYTPAADTSNAQALLTPLVSLGYSDKEAKTIKPETRSEVIKHHATLIDLDFSHAQIVKISERGPSLALVAQSKVITLFEILPDLTKDQLVDVAMKRSGNYALVELLRVAKDLKTGPLYLNAEQLVRIAMHGERPALKTVHALGPELTGQPYSLTPDQVVKIASQRGGQLALKAVKDHLKELTREPYSLKPKDVVNIASNHGGQLALKAVKDHFKELTSPPYSLEPKDVVNIASYDGGQLALKALKEHLKELTREPYSLEPGDMVKLASHGGGQVALKAFKDHLLEMTSEPYSLAADDVMATYLSFHY